MKNYSSVSPENISDDVINGCLTLLKRFAQLKPAEFHDETNKSF